jgi:hypothetical protein
MIRDDTRKIEGWGMGDREIGGENRSSESEGLIMSRKVDPTGNGGI